MLFGNAVPAARQILWGNVLLIGCAAFYLLWWALAFKPSAPVKGIASGWLLIPAVFLGIAAVVMIITGGRGAGSPRAALSGRALLLGGVAAYVALLLVTRLIFHRQVTSELFLITGWAVLALFEVASLYSLGALSRGSFAAFTAAAPAAALISLVCYILYYRLGPRSGYVDGMVPLILAALYSGALLVFAGR